MLLWILLLAQLGAGLFCSQVGGEEIPSWAGEWQTQWRTGGAVLSLEQDGNRVTGVYTLYDGQIEGTVKGRKLEGTWSEASGRGGGFLFTLATDSETFIGRFDSGEWWTGSRLPEGLDREVGSEDLSSPRETLRTFLIAANAARSGYVEQLRPALEAIDYSRADWPGRRTPDGNLFPKDRIDHARQLFRVLDELTFHIWSLPGAGDAMLADVTTFEVTLKQSGTSEDFDLPFIRRDGRWFIDAPPPSTLSRALEDLTERNGGRIPGAREHLELRDPRATMRTFLEEMSRLESGGWPAVRRTLDFEGLGVDVQEKEEQLAAHYLKHVIDRISFVIYQEIPDDSHQPSDYIHFRHAEGNVAIGPVRLEDGGIEWRFTAETLRALRNLYLAIEEMPEVPGVAEPEVAYPYFSLRAWLRSHVPILLHRAGAIEAWQWLAIVVFLFGSFLVSISVTWLLFLFQRLRKKTWDQKANSLRIRLALIWPLRVTILGVLWSQLVGSLALPEVISAPVRNIAATLAIASGLWLLYRGLALIGTLSSRTVGREGHTAILTSLTLGVTRVVMALVAALLLANIWEIPYTSVLAGLSVGGLALALAAKETLQNMIAGFTLFADSPLSVGDFCRYGDKLGKVEQIGLRSTRIRTLKRTVVTVPNSEFANMQLENFAKRDRMLLRTTIGVRYETTPDQLRFVLTELRRLLIGHPEIDEEPLRVRIIGFGAYSIDLEMFAYVRTEDWNQFLAIREDIYLRVMDVLEKAGAQFAFPSQVNYLAREPGIDGDRTSEAEEQVARWRAENGLPFPDLPPEEIEQIEDRLDYPPRGSVRDAKT